MDLRRGCVPLPRTILCPVRPQGKRAPHVNKACAVQDGWHQRAEPILIIPAHVRTVRQSGSAQVTLVMDDGEGGGYQNVEGDLKSVWEKLTGKVSTLEALDEHLTWTRRDPEVD